MEHKPRATRENLENSFPSRLQQNKQRRLEGPCLGQVTRKGRAGLCHLRRHRYGHTEYRRLIRGDSTVGVRYREAGPCHSRGQPPPSATQLLESQLAGPKCVSTWQTRIRTLSAASTVQVGVLPTNATKPPRGWKRKPPNSISRTDS